MNLIGIFLNSLVIGFSGAMMPGPLLTVAVSESAKRGWSVGPLLIVGHAVLELMMVLVLAAGFSTVLQVSWVFAVVGVLGGAFLFWMGYGILRAVWQRTVSLVAATTEISGQVIRGSNSRIMLTGATVSASNPYWIIWWIGGAGASLVTQAQQKGTAGLLSFYTGHISSDFVWYTLISVGVATGKRWLNDTVYRSILALCGLFLLYKGIEFIWTGWSSL